MTFPPNDGVHNSLNT